MTERADLFAIGIVVHESVTGSHFYLQGAPMRWQSFTKWTGWIYPVSHLQKTRQMSLPISLLAFVNDSPAADRAVPPRQ